MLNGTTGIWSIRDPEKKVLLKPLGADGESVCSSGSGVFGGRETWRLEHFCEILHHVREGNTTLISTVELCCIWNHRGSEKFGKQFLQHNERGGGKAPRANLCMHICLPAASFRERCSCLRYDWLSVQPRDPWL